MDEGRGRGLLTCLRMTASGVSAVKGTRPEVLDWLLTDLPDDTLVGFDMGVSLAFADAGAFFPGWSDSPSNARDLWAMVDALCEHDPHLAVTSFVDHYNHHRYHESLALNQKVDYPRGIAACLAALAALALRQGQLVRAARLLGAAEARLHSVAGKLFPTDQVEYDRTAMALRLQMDEASLDAARAEGRVMTVQQAADYALAAEER